MLRSSEGVWTSSARLRHMSIGLIEILLLSNENYYPPHRIFASFHSSPAWAFLDVLRLPPRCGLVRGLSFDLKLDTELSSFHFAAMAFASNPSGIGKHAEENTYESGSCRYSCCWPPWRMTSDSVQQASTGSPSSLGAKCRCLMMQAYS